MTIHHSPDGFENPSPAAHDPFAPTGPRITEHYWGLEIAPAEDIVTMAEAFRWGALLMTVGILIGSVGVWLMPAAVFAGDPTMSKVIASILLVAISGMLLPFGVRGTRVTLRINTKLGEIHEVAQGLFGTERVLSRYGMDTVAAVQVRPSHEDPDCGQIQLFVRKRCACPSG